MGEGVGVLVIGTASGLFRGHGHGWFICGQSVYDLLPQIDTAESQENEHNHNSKD